MNKTQRVKPKKLELKCMDKRFLPWQDNEHPHNDVLRMHNAGGTVQINELLRILKENPSIKWVHVVTHTGEEGTGCGAVGVIFTAIKDPQKYKEFGFSDKVGKLLVEPYLGRTFETKRELESIHNHVQRQRALEGLSKEFPDIKVTSEILDVSSINVPVNHGKHYLVLVPPSIIDNATLVKKAGAEMGGTYIIRATTMENAMPHIEVAVKALHVVDIRYNGFSNKDIEDMKSALRPINVDVTQFSTD